MSRLDQNVPHDFLSIPQPWVSLQLVYKAQQSRKFTYNYLYTIATHSYLIHYLK